MTTKKEKPLTQDKIKALQEAHLKEAAAYKQRVRPLVHFLRKNKLRFSHAQVGSERVEFFRLDDFEKLIKQKTNQIQANDELNALVQKASSQFVFFKRPEHLKTKYPKSLQPVLPTNTEKKFASFRFDTTESRRGMTILVILLILGLVMFPIWPFSIKYGIWLVSLVLLVVLVGIIVLRLLVYIVFAIFNYHIWIFPDLFYSNGILDSFLPVVQVTKGDGTWFNVFVRLFCLSSFCLLSLHIYLNPTFLEQTFQSTKVTINDVHDWGVAKIKNEGNFSQRALTNLDTILNETATVDEDGQVVLEKEETTEIEPEFVDMEGPEQESGAAKDQL